MLVRANSLRTGTGRKFAITGNCFNPSRAMKEFG
jgi:hypothetical protein